MKIKIILAAHVVPSKQPQMDIQIRWWWQFPLSAILSVLATTHQHYLSTWLMNVHGKLLDKVLLKLKYRNV